MTSFVSGSGFGTGTGNEIPILFLMYNDITARSANIQAGMGVALACVLKNNLMCTIEYHHMDYMVFVHSAATLPCFTTSTDRVFEVCNKLDMTHSSYIASLRYHS
jgi:hypothetical protein